MCATGDEHNSATPHRIRLPRQWCHSRKIPLIDPRSFQGKSRSEDAPLAADTLGDTNLIAGADTPLDDIILDGDYLLAEAVWAGNGSSFTVCDIHKS